MSKKIFNIAVIGGSELARLHAEGVLDAEGAELYAICDIAPERLENILKELKERGIEPKKSCNDYMELVNDPELDAVVLVTPDQTHCEMTCAFLRAGKAVLCEKPMALSMEECQEMMRCEKEMNGKLMIGQIGRCAPGFVLAKKLVDEGRIGEMMFIESEYAHNYAKAKGYAGWRLDPRRHGLIGGGCHAVDFLRWFAGDPTEVCAYANRKSLTDWPTDDTTIGILKFPNNVIGKVFVSTGCKRNYTTRSVIYGTKGTIICDNCSPSIQLFENNEELGKRFSDEPQNLEIIPVSHNAKEEIRVFVDSLVNDSPLPISSSEGANTVAVCSAIIESCATGMPVKVKYPTV